MSDENTKKAKCCTKREPECKNQPKCTSKELTNEQIWIYFLYFNFFYTLLRFSLTTKKDVETVKELVWFFIWIQLQLFYILGAYYVAKYIYPKLQYFTGNIQYFVYELGRKRETNPFMLWFGLVITDLICYYIYCIFFLLINVFLLLCIILFYGFTVFLLGLFLLGYYTVDMNKAV